MLRTKKIEWYINNIVLQNCQLWQSLECLWFFFTVIVVIFYLDCFISYSRLSNFSFANPSCLTERRATTFLAAPAHRRRCGEDGSFCLHSSYFFCPAYDQFFCPALVSQIIQLPISEIVKSFLTITNNFRNPVKYNFKLRGKATHHVKFIR